MTSTTERWLSAAFVGVLSLVSMIGFLYLVSASPYAYGMRGTVRWLANNWRELIVFLQTSWIGQTHWGLVAINQLHQMNGVHAMVQLIAVIAISFIAGFLFPNARSWVGRFFVSIVGSILAVPFSIMFLILNLSFPETIGFVLKLASAIWQILIGIIDFIPGGAGVANFAETGINGHHYVVIAMGSLLIHWMLRYGWDRFAIWWDAQPRHKHKIGRPT